MLRIGVIVILLSSIAMGDIVTTHIKPKVDNVLDLGTTTEWWRYVYAHTLDVTDVNVTSLTPFSLIKAGTNGHLEALGVATNGQLPIGSTGADPVLSTLTGTANEIDITNTAGSIQIGIVDPLIAAKGGTGLATIPDHSVMVGSGTGAVTPIEVGATGKILAGTTGADPEWRLPTVDVPIVLSYNDSEPARGSETNWNGGLLELDNAAAVNSGAPFVMSSKGSGKVIIVINAGGDLIGDITLTGTSVNRNTKVQTADDTSVITLNGTSTDTSAPDLNGNVVHGFDDAYISDKWFTGVVTITTADTAVTDMDIFHASFEQFNDRDDITLNTFDGNIFTTNVNAEFDAYLYDIHVTGSMCEIEMDAELHVGSVGGALAQASLAGKYYRLRQGPLNEAIDGTTDGIWVDIHYSNDPAYVEDVTLKVWATYTQALTLTTVTTENVIFNGENVIFAGEQVAYP